MLGNTPASTAAFSLDAPRAIASQNRTRCSRRPAGGCPPQRVPAAAARLHARFLLGIATPQRQALRQPVESTWWRCLLYAYARGNRSSRGIERACREDVAYKLITAMRVPDHSTIAEFRRRHERALAELFTRGAGVVR